MKKNGFTLVELMVVITIIGVLAAVAIPKFSAALHRDKIRTRLQDKGIHADFGSSEHPNTTEYRTWKKYHAKHRHLETIAYRDAMAQEYIDAHNDKRESDGVEEETTTAPTPKEVKKKAPIDPTLTYTQLKDNLYMVYEQGSLSKNMELMAELRYSTGRNTVNIIKEEDGYIIVELEY